MKQPVRFAVSAIATASILTAQLGLAQTPTPPSPPADQTAIAQTSTTITLPTGTVVPLTLVNMIKVKSTPIGGTIRATVAFPVTLGTQLAIPSGVFVEGELLQAKFPKGYKQPKGVPPASPLKVHFTRLIYPNGYTVTLDAQISTLLLPSENASRDAAQWASLDWPSTPTPHGPSMQDPVDPEAFARQQQPAPVTNPFAHDGPNPAVFYGPIIAIAAVGAMLVISSHHHGEALDAVAFGAGYPFEMTLTSPLVLDRSRIEKEATVTDAALGAYTLP